MSLAECVECGREVSDTALTCPHCGRHSPTISDEQRVEIDRRAKCGCAWFALPFVALALVVAGYAVFGDDPPPDPERICREQVTEAGYNVLSDEGEALERLCLDQYEP